MWGNTQLKSFGDFIYKELSDELIQFKHKNDIYWSVSFKKDAPFFNISIQFMGRYKPKEIKNAESFATIAMPISCDGRQTIQITYRDWEVIAIVE